MLLKSPNKKTTSQNNLLNQTLQFNFLCFDGSEKEPWGYNSLSIPSPNQHLIYSQGLNKESIKQIVLYLATIIFNDLFLY